MNFSHSLGDKVVGNSMLSPDNAYSIRAHRFHDGGHPGSDQVTPIVEESRRITIENSKNNFAVMNNLLDSQLDMLRRNS